ncbi:hypothetical protein JIG36_37120 [Actinoplanes sp. LDG1-06]|uniref:Uncharacterized protein n=1 Tax=Paractinoplanes ovalisporus TaxID=2810368 RepID=A0ABS2AMY2_9ACTN|nr:hypothetical protein [Actinoplanes ovalisporus]MBM2621138.1 hypothetical protein [Actinoplanes ovalisporus]
MIAPGNESVVLTLALGFLLSSAYAFGRIHQWHKRGLERDQAYRTGYDSASQSIINMMTARHSPASTNSFVHRPHNDRPQAYAADREEVRPF